MPALRVTCQNCQRVTVVDSDKVPDQPVAYRCPSCQSKVVIDKRKLLSAEAEAPSAPAVGAAPAARSGDSRDTGAASGERSSGSLVVAPDALLEMSLPPGESIPPGFLVAEDRETAAQFRRQLEPYDCTLESFADAGTARERALQEPPALLAFVADAVTKPPYAPLEPLVTLPPRDRRRVFMVLVASNVKSLDGNLAFLYQVDLLLNRQHVPQAAGILYSALRSHQRLYRPFLAALRE
jgi:hypothetical protein